MGLFSKAVSTSKIKAHMKDLREIQKNRAQYDPNVLKTKLDKIEGDFIKYVVRKFDIKHNTDIEKLSIHIREYVHLNSRMIAPLRNTALSLHGGAGSHLVHLTAEDYQAKFKRVHQLNLLEYSALSFYSHGGETINQNLRQEDKKHPLSKRQKFQRDCTDEALAKLNRHQSQAQVMKYFRGAATSKAAPPLIGDKQEGDIFSDKGYLSMTDDAAVAKHFMYKNDEQLPSQQYSSYSVTFGKQGVNIEANSTFFNEHEYLMPRNTQYQLLLRDDTHHLEWTRHEQEGNNIVAITTEIPQVIYVAEEVGTPKSQGTTGIVPALVDPSKRPTTTKQPSLINALVEKKIK